MNKRRNGLLHFRKKGEKEGKKGGGEGEKEGKEGEKKGRRERGSEGGGKEGRSP